MKKNTVNIFQRKTTVILLAVSCSVAWAFAFPLIKIGIGDFEISPGDTGSKTLFAGIRFFAAGITVLPDSRKDLACSEAGVPSSLAILIAEKK